MRPEALFLPPCYNYVDPKMNEIAPQVVGAIIGATVSMIVTIVVMWFTNNGHNKRQKEQHKHEFEQENLIHRREKLEECYLSFSKWQTYFGGMYVGMIGYVKRDMPEVKAYELGKGSSAVGSNEQVGMIISLYFPNLMESYKAVHVARGEIVKFFPPNSVGLGDVSGFYQAQENFEAKADAFKAAMCEELKKM